MRNISGKSCREKSKHILCSITFFFFENRAVYENVEKKCCIAGQATGGNVAHALCTLDT